MQMCAKRLTSVARATLPILLASLLSLGIATSALATNIVNGGFENGTGVTNPNNATPWSWTSSGNGERVNTLTNNPTDIGDGSSGGTQLIDPAFGSWFGYAENSGPGTSSDNISQSVTIDAATPVLTFWWQFFTNESPSQDNPFNDLFSVQALGSTSVGATVATVNSTPMVSTNGPLFTPTGGPPGQNQSFDLYTAGWSYYSLDVSALAGQNVTVYFTVYDVGGGHNESSGFALDNVQFVPAPEPASITIMGLGLLGLIGYALGRRKRPA